MNSRDRVLSALARQGCDRLPVKHEGTPEINKLLLDHFGLANHEQLLRVLGDDFRDVQPDYIGPELRRWPDGSQEGFWGERYTPIRYQGGTYMEVSHYPHAGIHRLEDLDRSHFPRAAWFDFSQIRAKCEALRGEVAIVFGSAGDIDFINSMGRTRGMEQVMMDLLTEEPVFLELMDARFQFYYDLHEAALQAAGGLIDIVHVGDDLGNQHRPAISFEIFDRLFAPRYRAFFAMAHRHGAKTMMHSCGCVEPFIDRLIDIGLDILDVVQPTTPEMDIAYLQEKYGARIAFCGTICVQSVLPFGQPGDVEREVRRRQALFTQGGLILGPTHAIQVGTPLENILALYRTAGSLDESLIPQLQAVNTSEGEGEFNLFKLF